jgi:hypothetical protein
VEAIPLKKRIEDFITEILTGDAQENALSFVSHLRTSDMQIERFTYHGEDTLHWEVKFQKGLVCYILLDSENSGWTIMPDNSSTERFSDFQADEDIREIAWKNINICHDGNRCGSCNNGRGTRIKIFGKEFDDVCGMAYSFTNPDFLALKLAKRMMDIRKSDIHERA